MRLAAFALWAVCFSTNAFAQTDSPLPPGKPAGIHQAVARNAENAILIGIGVAGLVVAGILVSKAKGPSSSTTSTSP